MQATRVQVGDLPKLSTNGLSGTMSAEWRPRAIRSTQTFGERLEFFYFCCMSHPLSSNYVDRICDPVRMVPAQPKLGPSAARAWMTKGEYAFPDYGLEPVRVPRVNFFFFGLAIKEYNQTQSSTGSIRAVCFDFANSSWTFHTGCAICKGVLISRITGDHRTTDRRHWSRFTQRLTVSFFLLASLINLASSWTRDYLEDALGNAERCEAAYVRSKTESCN